MSVLEIAANLRSELDYVESLLDNEIHSSEDLLEKAAVQLLNAGGKRIRPIFVLLAGRFGDFQLEKVGRVAVVLEMIHMASLVHDDVIDNAVTRRGRQTVRSQYGNRIAMYTGDFIFAKALSLLSNFTDARIHQVLADAIVRMTEGEIEQIRDFYRLDQTVKTYLRRIRRKTALLLQASCQLGALAAGCPDAVVNGLAQYGYSVGMAFQVTDDILDFTSTSQQLGKPVGNDIRQGNITYPVLYALQNPTARDELAALIKADMSDQDAERIIEIVKNAGGIEAARRLAMQYLDRGLRCLDSLPAEPARKALYKIARSILDRSS